MAIYPRVVKEWEAQYFAFKIIQTPMTKNEEADHLAHIASSIDKDRWQRVYEVDLSAIAK